MKCWALSFVILLVTVAVLAQEPATQSPAAKSEPTSDEPKSGDDKKDPPAPSASEKPKEPSTTTESPQEKPPATVPGEIPWKKPAVRLPASVKPVNTPRELLDVRGIKETEWERTVDGEAWSSDDDELLLKLLLHFPRFSLVEIHRWQKPVRDWTKFLEASAEKRGEITLLTGRVKRIERRELIEELVERYEYEHYYRVLFQPTGESHTSELFVRSIPAVWKVGEDVNYHFQGAALFLKRGSAEENQPRAYFAGDHCAWLPTEPDDEMSVTADHVLLASRGFNVGLLHDLVDADGRPLDEFDREPMHLALFAAGQLEPQDWREAKPKALELTQLLSQPKDHRLQFVRVGGTVRRIVKVLMDSEDAERLGFPHYYELDFFIPLGNQVIKLGQDKKDAKAPIFRNDFPATLCVLELPPGLKEGEKVTYQISAEAVFYRVWSYRSQFMAQFQMTHQPAPLFIGKSVRKIDDVVPALAVADKLVIGLVLGSIAILAAVIYFAGRKSTPADSAAAKGFNRRIPLPDKIAPPPVE